MKTKYFVFCFALSSAFTNLPLRGEYRMRLNNENKILRLLFCIVFGFHYICNKM